MMDLRSSSITVDGIRSPVIEAGAAGAKEAVVYVHGSPGSGAEFARQIADTGEFARAIAIDMPGFGQADKPHPHDFEYSVPNIGIHLAKQLDLLGVERAHFVGHDFGGGFSITAAMYEPQRTASLALVNSGVMRGYRWHIWARLWRWRGLGELLMATTNKQGFKMAQRTLPADFVDQMWGNFDRRTRRAVLALYRHTNHEEQTPQIPLLRAINIPAIVIFGADDPYIDAARFAPRNLEAFPSASVHLIENCGHWPHVEAPERFSQLLLPYLRGHVTDKLLV